MAVSGGGACSKRTLQRHFARLGLNTRPDGSPPRAFGRFEASAPNDVRGAQVRHSVARLPEAVTPPEPEAGSSTLPHSSSASVWSPSSDPPRPRDQVRRRPDRVGLSAPSSTSRATSSSATPKSVCPARADSGVRPSRARMTDIGLPLSSSNAELSGRSRFGFFGKCHGGIRRQTRSQPSG